MRVQTKITLLLALVVTTFLVGLFAFRAYDRSKFRRVAEQRLQERQQSFEEFLDHNGAALKALVEDYTCWDQMVRAIARQDMPWLTENVNRSTLDSFHAQAVWIFRTDGTLAHSFAYPDFADLEDFPIPAGQLSAIFAHEPLAHFFINSSHGIVEVRGGTVHPSKDFRRETPPQGYFFAGRLWNQPTLDEMSIFTGNRVRIAPVAEVPRNLGADEHSGTVAFTRSLKSWQGEPLAQLVVRNESPVVQELNRESEILLLSLTIFALVLLLLISTLLMRWVRRPLSVIMESLNRNDPAPIAPMCSDNSEFGELARTVRSFFSQRDNLIREMEERRTTEETLRKKEDELRQSQKMEAVGRLAGGVAHDFNNLLTAIIGYAELIADRSQRDPLVKQNARLIGKAGEQAATLTRQLLAFSRKQLLQPKVLDLNHLVADMEKLLRRVIGEHFQLRTRSDAVDGRVKADPGQLEQVILNLSVNARDAMPTGGTVTIRTSNEHLDQARAAGISKSMPEGDYVVLSVTDTGTGMDDETKARIFEPFFTTKGPGKGTGLGLATVYGIVRQSGGGISVESEMGRGTIFRIYLPYERSTIDLVRPAAQEPVAGNNSETVLVVEDDDAVRQLVCDVLEEHGYTILCAPNGPEAIRMAEKYQEEIDLLVTDVVMPHMNGPELASRLSLTRPELKVLYVSGYSADDVGDHGVLHDKIEFLQKPFSPHALLQRMREVLSRENDWSADGERADTSQLQFSI
jgi:signal transduction histidine kinase/ActR/RegA family two-component response regulator